MNADMVRTAAMKKNDFRITLIYLLYCQKKLMTLTRESILPGKNL